MPESCRGQSLSSSRKILLLHGQTLDRRFYDHVAARHNRIQSGAAADSVTSRLDAIMRYQAGCRNHSKTGLDSVETCLNSFLRDVVKPTSYPARANSMAMPCPSFRRRDRISPELHSPLHGFLPLHYLSRSLVLRRPRIGPDSAGTCWSTVRAGASGATRTPGPLVRSSSRLPSNFSRSLSE